MEPKKQKRPSKDVRNSILKSAFLDILKPIEKVNADPIVIDPNEFRIWFIGHATVLINLYGTTILTDPVLTNWIPFPRRIVAPGYKTHELPNLDYIIVSHAHMDHFSRPTLRKLAHKTKTIILAKNCSDLIDGFRFKNIVEMDWDETYNNNELTFHAVKPEHWGKRVPWEKMRRQYNSIVIEKNDTTIFFGGDSGYGPFYKEVGEKFDVDVALMSIGAYSPESFRKVHKNPDDTIQAFTDLEAKHLLPIHWGSFRLSLEPMDEPPKWLARLAEEEGLTDKIHILQNGESKKFPK